MDIIGLIKEIDGLGRIVIPKELRKRYFLNKSVEIIATKDGVLLRNPEYTMVTEDKKTPSEDNENN